MLRLLHLADLHLGWAPAFMEEPRRSERRRRRDELLRRAVDFALRPGSGVGLVVIVGDLFETHRPEPGLAASVMDQLSRLVRAGVQVVTVPGNHDEITYRDSVYRKYAGEWPGVLVQNPLPEKVGTLEAGGVTVHVYSLAYTGGLTPTRPALASFPRAEGTGFHLAAFHGTLGEWAGERSLPLDGAALGAAGYDYVALGHLHRHERHNLGGAPAVYCGAVEGKGFDDPGVGQWTVVEVDMPPGAQRPQVRVRTEPAEGVCVLERVTVDAGRFADEGTLRAEIEKLADPKRMLQVRLTGAPEYELDVQRLRAALADRFFHLAITDEDVVLAAPLLDRWAGEPTIRGLFVRRMRERLEAAGDEEERRVLQRALRQGIHALAGGGGR
jgi:DNA repair exonuclease SbcCD nuclease subunit